MYQLHNFQFPKDFKFGVADADLQVIGEEHTLKHENSEPTMWTAFAKRSNSGVYQNQTPLSGIDRYHRWKEDITLIKKLGTKHYRTSVSMSRVMTRDGKPNKKALEWYIRYFEALRKAGITIYVTLYHWELPEYLHQQGGWKNREVVHHLVKHAQIVYEYLNDYIEEYFILNEPFQSTFESYHNGFHAPGEKNLKGALAAVHHTLLAQGMVFHALRALDKKIKLSTVYNPRITYAASSDPQDIKAAQYAFAYQTSIFTDPLYRGCYPDEIMELFGDKMPKIHDGDMKMMQVGHGLHSFGVNFYRGTVNRYDKAAEAKFAEVRYPQGIVNGLGWPVNVPPTYPESLYDLLRELYHRYGNLGMKRLYISENGTCWDDKVNEKGEINDEFRIFYVREHLQQVAKAILSGVPVEGYFLWSLIDNYEWDLGYMPGSNFGIVYADRTTMNRIPKQSYYWYRGLNAKKSCFR